MFIVGALSNSCISLHVFNENKKLYATYGYGVNRCLAQAPQKTMGTRQKQTWVGI